MKRRKFLIGAGSLAAGSAAAMGTGAFSTAEVRGREFRVDVAADSEAYVELNALNNKYAEETEAGQLRVAVGPLNERPPWDSHPEGVNANSTFNFDEVFQVANPGGWGDLRFAIALHGFSDDIEVELTANGSEADDIAAGTSLLVGDYDDVDNLPKLVQPDACNVDMKITNTADSAVDDIGGTMTIYAATGGNRGDLENDTSIPL